MPVGEFKRAVDQVIRDIRNSQKLPGVERIWLPGEQSHTKLLDRRAHGVPMPKALRESLDAVARELEYRGAGVRLSSFGARRRREPEIHNRGGRDWRELVTSLHRGYGFRLSLRSAGMTSREFACLLTLPSASSASA